MSIRRISRFQCAMFCIVIMGCLHLMFLFQYTSPCLISTTSEKHDISADRYIAPGKYVCRNTLQLFHNMSSIEAAYEEAENFHNHGGNLKSVEHYLNDQIDPTLKMQDLAFYAFNNSTIPPNTTVTEWVRQLQKTADKNKSGGYDQHFSLGAILPKREEPYRGYLRKNKQFWFRNLSKNTTQVSEKLKTVRIMNARKVQKFDAIEPIRAFQRWRAGIGPILDICKNVNRITGEADNGFDDKFMCSFDELKKEKSSFSIVDDQVITGDGNQHTNSECSMISIGSNGQWGFERTIVNTTACTTHTFDCTVARAQRPKIDSIHFYHYCIADEQKEIGGRKYLTYSQMVNIAGISGVPTLFKMDVEGFEYDVITQIIVNATKTHSNDELPSQISVELHYATRMYDLPWLLRLRQAGEIAMFTGMMYRVGGYLPVNVQYNMGCDSCAEILFVHVFCDK